MKEYEEIMRQKGLPNVGQVVRSKKYNTLWRVIEKRELWQDLGEDPETKEPRWIHAIYLNYWRVQKGVEPGMGNPWDLFILCLIIPLRRIGPSFLRNFLPLWHHKRLGPEFAPAPGFFR